MGLEDIVFPEHVLSEDDASAAILEDLEYDGYLQARGEGPGCFHLANRFLNSAVGELQ